MTISVCQVFIFSKIWIAWGHDLLISHSVPMESSYFKEHFSYSVKKKKKTKLHNLPSPQWNPLLLALEGPSSPTDWNKLRKPKQYSESGFPKHKKKIFKITIRKKKGGEGDDRGRDGWMASPTQPTWVWTNSGRWWRTGKPGMLQSMGLQRVGHDWVTEQQQQQRKIIELMTELENIFLYALSLPGVLLFIHSQDTPVQ